MKKAWIENNVVRDIANGNPAELFHPDIAVNYDTDVPDDIIVGATLENGVWVNPAPIEPPETTEPVVEYKKVTPIEFKLLFTSTERIAVKQSTDAIVQDFYELTNDPRLNHVDLGLKSTQDALAYMVSIGLITDERKAEILAGNPV